MMIKSILTASCARMHAPWRVFRRHESAGTHVHDLDWNLCGMSDTNVFPMSPGHAGMRVLARISAVACANGAAGSAYWMHVPGSASFSNF